jgi:copper chaperone CopZ
MNGKYRFTSASRSLLFLSVLFYRFMVQGVTPEEAALPHTPTLIFYLSGADGPKDVEAIRESIGKLKSATLVEANTNRSYARVRFDSHVVSYHQVAQALADAGATVDKHYDPRLKITVPEYSKGDNAAKVDAVFTGKRLNQRVTVQRVDPAKGIFLVHFLPLMVDATNESPQGFNGGHLNHPIHDAPPRGLGLTFIYAEDYDSAGSTDSNSPRATPRAP